MTVLRLPRERLLFLVDLANPRTLGYRMLPDSDPLEIIRSLRAIEELDFDRVAPGHRDPVAPAAVVSEQRRYYEDLGEAVREQIEAGAREPEERVWAHFHMGW